MMQNIESGTLLLWVFLDIDENIQNLIKITIQNFDPHSINLNALINFDK